MNLKDVLRKGDPASGDPGLSAEEIRAMRRTVLSAARAIRLDSASMVSVSPFRTVLSTVAVFL